MAVKRKKFKTEVQKLLDIVIHSLYSHRDIFLRELISNASDAIDRARFEALSNKDLLEEDPNWKIQLLPNKDDRTLTIRDNGIGMSPEEVEQNIGTIARSGTKAFLDQLAANSDALSPELIGQFGVGFYSAFMVADKVTVATRRADCEVGTKWVSSGTGSYTTEEVQKDTRGTDITLHLKEEMDEYLEEWRLRKIVKQYSDFVEHAVVLPVERTSTPRDAEGKEIEGAEPETTITEETLNSRKAIWTRPRNEVTDEEYSEFYKHISHDFQEPLERIHYVAEGTTEFRALLYLPKHVLPEMSMPDNKHRGVQLYIRRVFITDNCEALLPQYLRFLRGVVDSSDLPLNISREVLQEDRVVRRIQSNLVSKALSTLKDMKAKNRDNYVEFWRQFGPILKEGMHFDFANREKLEDLLLFESSTTEAGTYTSLEEYVERMGDEQKAIYYITGESRMALEGSPHLEALKARNYEVLFLSDPIDEWVVQSLPTFKEKPLQNISKGDLDLDSDEEKTEKEEQRKQAEETYGSLVEFVKNTLGDKVKDVKLSSRLTDSACCLVTDEFGMGVHMEKLMKAMNQDMPATKRILELNPAHPLTQNMETLLEKDPSSARLGDYVELLYDQALLTAGLPVGDPLAFTKRISNLMAEGAVQDL